MIFLSREIKNVFIQKPEHGYLSQLYYSCQTWKQLQVSFRGESIAGISQTVEYYSSVKQKSALAVYQRHEKPLMHNSVLKSNSEMVFILYNSDMMGWKRKMKETLERPDE